MEKIMEIDEHIGCAMSGLIADARHLSNMLDWKLSLIALPIYTSYFFHFTCLTHKRWI